MKFLSVYLYRYSGVPKLGLSKIYVGAIKTIAVVPGIGQAQNLQHCFVGVGALPDKL